MSKNQSDSQESEEYRPDFPPEAYEEELEVLLHNEKVKISKADFKKLMSMAEPDKPKK